MFRVTGAATYGPTQTKIQIDTVIECHWPDDAVDTALRQAMVKTGHDCQWADLPTVEEIPTDQAMRMLGEAIAPRLPGF